MASGPESGIDIDKALFAVAARVARDKCRLHKAQIADRAGMSPRMLHRLLTGRTRATESQRDRILVACNLPTMTSRLLAESHQADLIGTGAHDWLEGFVRDVIANLAFIETESGMGVEGKWAASDAALIFARWQKIIEHRQAFLTEFASGDWPGREPWKR